MVPPIASDKLAGSERVAGVVVVVVVVDDDGDQGRRNESINMERCRPHRGADHPDQGRINL